ncbi:hypothetical protein Tc00.1047053508221.220 [Trypanosoma cruzi]|uniref:Uncharacterized protein n=1 Tax=Trypanosoma cruzi (strain CL Brener) TaxID=353153 RepID=Q4E5W7_TRYCC|nr:hypothetical protein Tc00.1047053508221.220 [Trypanosoma cruzi]EAO00144.1 hypothetical protein Tc00.1047053508221.220 [Trypanosoma cruzi]|eukprot:XP_821995.1 hypothetical protein [Trypanosoma cruzi strain CL Brener]
MPAMCEGAACSWGILLSSLFLLCRMWALLGVCWRVTNGATMAYSDDDSRCALGTHPHTLPCLSVRMIAAVAWSMAAAVGAAENEAPREKRANLLDAITMADESCFVAFASYIAKNAPCRRLTECLHSAPFEALCSFIQCDATIIMAAPSLTGSECDNTNDGKGSDEDYGDDLHRGADYLRVLAHESREGLNAVPTIPGLAEPLAFALSPAVISAHALRLIHLPWSSRSSSRVVVLLIPRWSFRTYLSVAWRMI